MFMHDKVNLKFMISNKLHGGKILYFRSSITPLAITYRHSRLFAFVGNDGIITAYIAPLYKGPLYTSLNSLALVQNATHR